MINYVAVYDSDDIFKVLGIQSDVYHLECLNDGTICDIDAENIDRFFTTFKQAKKWQDSLIPDDVPHPFFREDYPNLRLERTK